MSARNSQNGTDDDAKVSPVRLLPHDNPCPNPQLPPLLIEMNDPYVPGNLMRRFCIRTILAYQKQATNMTQLDQKEYLSLLEASCFKMNHYSVRGPCHHPLYWKLRIEPTWAKFVFLSALYPDILVIEGQPTLFQQQMLSTFKSLEMKNDKDGYLFYKRNPQLDDDQDNILSSSTSGAHPDLLDTISTMQNAIMKLDEKLDATREEMRQQREQREQHEETMQNAIMRLDENFDTIREEMRQQGEESKQKFETGVERIFQQYSCSCQYCTQ